MLVLGLDFLADEILLLIKAKVARELSERGYSQVRIARVLGITQPMVNKMLNQYDYYMERADKLGVRSLVDDIGSIVVELVAYGKFDEASRYLTHRLIMELGSLRLCRSHRLVKPDIPEGCTVCSVIVSPRDAVLDNLKEAVRLLETNPEVSLLVPGVLMNIAESMPNPRDASDVAAIPGRIDKVGDRVKAWNPPAYGASGHLARILIGLSLLGISGVRSVASVRWGQDVDNAMQALGWRYVKVGGSGSPTEDEVIDRVVKGYVSGGSPDVVVDMGGYGIEPITYIFGRDSMDVALRIIRLARHLAKHHGGKAY